LFFNLFGGALSRPLNPKNEHQRIPDTYFRQVWTPESARINLTYEGIMGYGMLPVYMVTDETLSSQDASFIYDADGLAYGVTNVLLKFRGDMFKTKPDDDGQTPSFEDSLKDQGYDFYESRQATLQQTLRDKGWKWQADYEAVGIDAKDHFAKYAQDPAGMNLHETTVLRNSNEMFDALKEGKAKRDPSSVIVYIHGYNNDIETALLTSADISSWFYEPAICYSWPSKDKMSGYLADEATVRHDVDRCSKFLKILRARYPKTSITLIAHSLGNRLVLRALTDQNNPIACKFEQLILLSPDVARHEFKMRFSELKTVCEKITILGASNDRALALSSFIHFGDRLGVNVSPYSGVTVIDTTKVAIPPYNHTSPFYFLSNIVRHGSPGALADLIPPKTASSRQVYKLQPSKLAIQAVEEEKRNQRQEIEDQKKRNEEIYKNKSSPSD